MKKRTAKQAISKIAKREGISEYEVRREMETAILSGFMNIETRQKWNSIFGKGRLPSPGEFIRKVSNLVAK